MYAGVHLARYPQVVPGAVVGVVVAPVCRSSAVVATEKLTVSAPLTSVSETRVGSGRPTSARIPAIRDRQIGGYTPPTRCVQALARYRTIGRWPADGRSPSETGIAHMSAYIAAMCRSTRSERWSVSGLELECGSAGRNATSRRATLRGDRQVYTPMYATLTLCTRPNPDFGECTIDAARWGLIQTIRGKNTHCPGRFGRIGAAKRPRFAGVTARLVRDKIVIVMERIHVPRGSRLEPPASAVDRRGERGRPE
jgi:hypothetical protein